MRYTKGNLLMRVTGILLTGRNVSASNSNTLAKVASCYCCSMAMCDVREHYIQQNFCMLFDPGSLGILIKNVLDHA